MKDIEKFKPKFVRFARDVEEIIFDCVDDHYVARDTNKNNYEGLKLENYLERVEREQGVLSYHISLKSADNKRALLVFESDEVGGEEIILKLGGLVRDKNIKFILKDSGNRSLHLVIPILCNDNDNYEKMFNSVLYLLGEKERAFIDLHLNNLNGQVRGFESRHLKTYNISSVKSGSLENVNIDLCSENTKLINSFSGVFQKKDLTSVGKMKGGVKPRASFLFEDIGLAGRGEQLLEIARNLKKGERAVSITYLASKLISNEVNKKFLEKFVKAIRDKKDFNVNEELGKVLGVMGRNYSKKSVEKTERGREIVKALYGYQKEIFITRGIKEKWDEYLKYLEGIEKKEIRDKKIKEFNEAKAFLEERKFLEFIPDARNGIQIYHSLKLMENSAGMKITRENYSIEDLGFKEDMIKGDLAERGLKELESELGKIRKELGDKKLVEFKPEIPAPAPNDYGDFGFMNKGDKKFTKIYYDIETDYKQEPCLIGVLNKDLKRIVIARIVKEIRLKEGEQKINPRFEKSYKNGFEIIRCEVVNGYEAVFLGDSESYLACVCNSLMRQGDKTPSILKDMIKGVDINFKIFSEIYNNKRRSLWIAHNSNFDINKLNLTSRNGLVHIDSDGVKVEDIVINTFGNKRRYLGYLFNPDKNLGDREKWGANYKLGNRDIGVHFKASTKKYGLWEKPEIELKPIQRESDNYVYGLDSVLIARALQKKKAGLKDLGEEYDLAVKKSESEYNFNGGELWSDKKKDIGEIEYLIKDLFVTDYVFRELCKELDVFEDLLGLVKVDKDRIKRHASEMPYLYRVYSTASLSKLFYQIKYSEDYDDWKVKHGNSKFYENINELFKEVYSGGRVEIFKHGIIKDKKIIYSDFASLYPHTSYLTNVEPLMNDILNKKLSFTSDIDKIEADFWGMIHKLVKKIENKDPFDKSDFCDSAVLNVKLDCDLRLSRKASIFRGKVRTDANKRNRCDLIINSNSVVNTSVYDLCYGVLEKHLIDNVSLEDLHAKIIFNKGLMVVPSYKTNKTNDMHTLLYDRRGGIREEIKRESDEEKKKHLESQSQFIKIVLNAGYGITAEFTNDRAGQFYNPILASSITGMARLLNNLTEITTKYYGFKCYYGDTDSLLLDSDGYGIVSSLFKDICELQNELGEGVFIKDMIIVGAKEYAYFTNNKKEFAVKTHGVGYRARGYKDVLENLFRNLINGVDKDTAIKEAVSVAPILRNFNFSHVYGRTTTLYTNLSDMINKKSEVLGEYKIGDNVFKCYQYGKTGLFISDCENVTKGTFGSMFRLSEPKIYLFSVKYGFNEEMLREILENIEGIPEEKRIEILKRLDSKYSEVLFLNKYLGKNEDNVKRKILECGVGEGNDCVPFDCDVKEDIDISFNEKELELDGVEYCGMVELPKFDFASKMQADLTTFYSKSIASISKSLSYWFAKRQNPEGAEEVFNKRNNELLIPQKKNEILVPLNMVEVPENYATIIRLLKEKKTKEAQLTLSAYTEPAKPNELRQLKKKYKKFEDIKDNLLAPLKPRNAIITEEFNKKKYWFEVTSYKSNKHNAILRINVVVGNPPRLKYYLWINPTPFFNVNLWKASYTDLMFSSEGLSRVVNKVFEIAYNNSERSHGAVTYNSILSGFSRGSSYSLKDLRGNNKYFLDICYVVACSFIVMNSVKHSSLRIGRLDLSYNVNKKISEDKQDLVITFLQKQLNREVNDFLDYKSKKDFVERIKLGEEVYTASGGHYSGLVNKRTKISQIIYNKSKQLEYKLLKSSRKKNFNVQMLEQLRINKDNFNGMWRLEVQAYGYKAIQKAVNSYDTIMKKMNKLLFVVVKLVNKIDMREFVVLKKFGEENKDFSYWFNDLTNERYKPPLLLVT